MRPVFYNWPSHYIGEPWIAGEHDCWHFARRVWREVFGFAVPPIEVDALNRMASTRAFGTHPEVAAWTPLAAPEDGAGVLLGKSSRACHVGVWANCDGGGVVHCIEHSGVVFQPLPALAAAGWRVLGYYRRGA